MARPGKKAELTKEEKNELITMSRSMTLQQRYVLRAKIILHWSDGRTLDESESLLSISRPTIVKWRKRFLAKRLAGLKDAPRPGKQATITAEIRVKVIKLACQKPGKGYTNWSQRRIAKEVGTSQSGVCRILKEANLKPHKTEYWCGKSTDPEFEKKVIDIVGLYLSPPQKALVLCVDEKTQIQALDRTQPELPLRKGNPRRLTTTYKRHGTVSLIAALAVHEGEITAKTMAKNNSANFLAFLKSLYRKYPRKELHIVLDNLSVHKNKQVMAWAKQKGKLTLHFTPTYSSWLNQIEIWFNILTKDVLKGGIWHSKKQLVSQILEYIKTYNKERAKPFRWTYTGKALVA
jgi:transposase